MAQFDSNVLELMNFSLAIFVML